LKPEADLEKEIDKNLESLSWPASGAIEFNEVKMRYREGLEYSIKGLNVSI